MIQKLLSVLFVLGALTALQATASTIPSALTGHWSGRTRVIVTWCGQSELSVWLDIFADGSVTGAIGDAELTNVHIANMRKWLLLKDPAAYLIKGQLKGPVVAAEGIQRRDVFVHLRFDGACITGGLATSGSKMGGKETMILTTTSLHLSKSP